jgi:hypothetical protein
MASSEAGHGPSQGAVPRLAYSIKDFCISHRISEALYFKLKRQGRAPIEMVVGARRLISIESAAAWRRQCEAANNKEDDR